MPPGEQDPNIMLVQLLPRSANGAETPLKSKEVTFVLNQLDINLYKQKTRMVIPVFETWVKDGYKQTIGNRSCICRASSFSAVER
jgi:hypothetical protein